MLLACASGLFSRTQVRMICVCSQSRVPKSVEGQFAWHLNHW